MTSAFIPIYGMSKSELDVVYSWSPLSDRELIISYKSNNNNPLLFHENHI